MNAPASRRDVRVLAALAIGVGLFAATARGEDRRHERGFPPIEIHPQQEHGSGPQSFDVAQDGHGILYFANLDGVLTYDGAWWRTLPLPHATVAYTIESDAANRIAVGGVNELGHLVTDDAGSTSYRSLIPLLPPSAREVGDVTGICAADRGFFFVTNRYLIQWDGSAARVVADFRPTKLPPSRCFRVDDRSYLAGESGLQRIEEASLPFVPGFEGKRVDVVIPGEHGDAVVSVRGEGLFILGRDGVTTPLASAAAAWTKEKIVTSGCRLADGRIVIATRQDGLAIVAADGSAEIIDREAGLPDEVLSGTLADREGSLWLAFQGPLVRVDVAAPVTIVDGRRGIRGSPASLARHHGRLYAGTTHGLFVLAPAAPDAPVGRMMAKQIAGISTTAWSLLPDGDELLAGTAGGVYRVPLDGPAVPITGTERYVAYLLVRSQADPQRVWMTTRNGLGVLQRDANGWRFAGIIPGTPPYIRSLIEDQGSLWGGTIFNGIVRIDITGPLSAHVRQFGDDEKNITLVGGRRVITTRGAILELTADGRFVPDHLLGHIRDPKGFHRIAEDSRGNVWLNSIPPRVVLRQSDGTFAAEGTPLRPVAAGDIQRLQCDPDGVTWFFGNNGFFRYEPFAGGLALDQPAPLIRRAATGENETLFSGATAAARAAAVLDPAFRRLRIEFAPVSYRPGVTYQYRLEPQDAQWSAWTSQPFIDYTNLAEGSYTFRLRARGAGAVSDETRWSFSVSPPWYRSGWAYAVWVLLAVAVVLVIVRMRTRALHRQAERLRGLVSAKTDELRQIVEQLRRAQDELMEKNELLEQANGRLERLSLLDELTGIANRRYFQRALADDWDRAREREQPLALILLDIDHFKQLNDAQGHPAGDACLRAVGSFLAQQIRRSGDLVTRGGDVVARYGGEEFAILLADTTGNEAMLVAEMLRAGLERMPIAAGDEILHVTASCGVASMVPSSGDTYQMLVDRSDRALYAAKHDGRNLVRYATESTAMTGGWVQNAPH